MASPENKSRFFKKSRSLGVLQSENDRLIDTIPNRLQRSRSDGNLSGNDMQKSDLQAKKIIALG